VLEEPACFAEGNSKFELDRFKIGSIRLRLTVSNAPSNRISPLVICLTFGHTGEVIRSDALPYREPALAPNTSLYKIEHIRIFVTDVLF
jgi:hypothetical protein